MDTHTTLVNVSNELNLDQLLKLFDLVRFSTDGYSVLRTITPPVENLRSLYTADAAGLTLKLWGVACKYNSYGQFLIIKALNDYRKQSDFITQIRKHPKYFTHEPTGSLLYEKGFMGWHTNYDDAKPADVWDLRIYMTYNADAESVFKYITPLNEVVTLREPQGWSIKVFDVTHPFWHCVESGQQRISLGTRLLLIK